MHTVLLGRVPSRGVTLFRASNGNWRWSLLCYFLTKRPRISRKQIDCTGFNARYLSRPEDVFTLHDAGLGVVLVATHPGRQLAFPTRE